MVHRSEVVGRDPDFVIIGAMKAGTTTLFRWFEGQPECAMPRMKEPEFFAREELWDRGLDWYRSLFIRPELRLSGEASVVYTDPDVARMTARRMAESLPSAKLLFLARHPVERLRSHYRHEVQRNREDRSLLQALSEDRPSVYIKRSMYGRCLEPFFDEFELGRVHVAFFERLYDPTDTAEWHDLLSFIGLSARPPPPTAENVTAEKQGFSRFGRRLWERNLLKAPAWAPNALRKAGRAVAFRHDDRFGSLMRSGQEPIPPEVLTPLDEDMDRFLSLIGRRSPWNLHA